MNNSISSYDLLSQRRPLQLALQSLLTSISQEQSSERGHLWAGVLGQAGVWGGGCGQGRAAPIRTLLKGVFHLLLSAAVFIAIGETRGLLVHSTVLVTCEYQVRFVRCLQVAAVHLNSASWPRSLLHVLCGIEQMKKLGCFLLLEYNAGGRIFLILTLLATSAAGTRSTEPAEPCMVAQGSDSAAGL